jgi:ACS family hexuronate transporter-like MFS transporter
MPSASHTEAATTTGMPPVLRQVRWWVLSLLLLATIINFVDRQSLSVVAPLLRESLHLSNTQYGTIVAFFQFGLMSGEFPMGWLMDRMGVRFGLSLAVAWWSLANILHTFARTLAQFCGLRFWLGSGMCGNYSGGVKVVTQWFPVRARALAVGIFNGGSMLGSIIAPPLLVLITLRFGWHAAFLVPGALGFLWVFGWRAVYHPPEQHPHLTAAEKAYIDSDREENSGPRPSNWKLLSRKETWAIMLCRGISGPVVAFYIFWMPEYLYRVRGLSLASIGMFAWLPFLFGAIGSIGGGWWSRQLLSRGINVTSARRITMGTGAACCLCSLAVSAAVHWITALAWICVVLMGHTCFAANLFAVISDLYPENAVGRVTALTGVSNGLTGMLFPLLTGYLVDKISYAPVFLLASFMPLVACALLWIMVPQLHRVKLVEG